MENLLLTTSSISGMDQTKFAHRADVVCQLVASCFLKRDREYNMEFNVEFSKGPLPDIREGCLGEKVVGVRLKGSGEGRP